MPARPLFPWLRLTASIAPLVAISWGTCAEPQRFWDESPAWVDVAGPDAIAWPMNGPLHGQKRPPCQPRLEEERQGACWVLHTLPPPCPPGTAELTGHCYLPVRAPPVPNTAVNR